MAQTKNFKQTTELFTPEEIAIRKAIQEEESKIESHWSNYFAGHGGRQEAEEESEICKNRILSLRMDFNAIANKRLSAMLNRHP